MERTITMTNIQAIFIDRDGTIGGDTTIHYPDHLHYFLLQKHHCKIKS